MTGAVVSTTVTVWLHWGLLVQASVACQVRVASKVLPQWPAVLVTVLRMVMVAVSLLSVAVGGSKVQARPSTSLYFSHVRHSHAGFWLSKTVTVWLHPALLVRASV